MLNRHSFLLPALALIGTAVSGQQVISARSGLVNYFEGRVLLGEQPLQPIRGRYFQLENGSVLRTESGKAEILLAPDVFARLGENSSFRMITNDLTNIQVEFLSGSLIVQSNSSPTGVAATVLFHDQQIRLPQGSYRFDADPARLRVPTPSQAAAPPTAAPPTKDEFDTWCYSRNQASQNGGNSAHPQKSRHVRLFPEARASMPYMGL